MAEWLNIFMNTTGLSNFRVLKCESRKPMK